ncbi:hypothetical protein L1987_26236 [Smallanthus sonchifolius]|uniref:Uncharacterized protein n=1 Tax=Smallanthus sonchifolius TaxID=185202 RepID=A0ACB9IAR1_9ASTR|nr:hypothetical protein L1987_26236 [Smallanthus sonchifolius]
MRSETSTRSWNNPQYLTTSVRTISPTVPLASCHPFSDPKLTILSLSLSLSHHHHPFSFLFLHSLKSRFFFLSLWFTPSCLLNRRSTKIWVINQSRTPSQTRI